MSTVRNLIFKALRYSGLPFLFREIGQRKKVSIVMFHDLEPAVAERSFGYLARHYNLISLDTYLDACRRGDDSQLPPKALIITLDDGHLRNYELLPLIRKHHIPVTIFLCSGIIDTNRHYWFKFRHPNLLKPALKQMTNRQKLELLAKAGFTPETEFPGPQALNRRQILEMQPYVNFQGHTHFHPCLPKCYDEEARLEIEHSKQVLEQNFNLRINALAYPNGDYSDRDIALVKEAGYECGITVDYGFNTIHSDLYRLKRLSIDDPDNIDAVCVKASGVWTLLLSWLGKREQYRKVEAISEGPKRTPAEVLRHLPSLFLLHAFDIPEALLTALA